MKKLLFLVLFYTSFISATGQSGKVGINTTSPQAMLHVKDSSVLFSGGLNAAGNPGNPPASGSGVRMMWYPAKAAFRAGAAVNTSWDKDSIGDYSFAVGEGTVAKGTASFAAGTFAFARGYSSFAAGTSSRALGSYSFAVGNSAIAGTAYDISIGYLTQATGGASLALGYNTEADGANSIAAGFNSQSSGYLSTAMGNGVITRGYGNVAFGSFNDPILASANENFLNPLPNSPVFMVGNGTASNRKNAILIQRNGKVGIGNVIPDATLHLKGLEATFNAHIKLESFGSTDYSVMLYDGSTKFRNFGSGDDYQFRNADNLTLLRIYESGAVSIAGSLTQNSDMRLKRNIVSIENALDKVCSVSGYHYLWKDNIRDSTLQSGLIAQEIEKNMPELVRTDEEGIKSVNYNGMIPYLVEAIKELKKENEELRKELRSRKSK